MNVGDQTFHKHWMPWAREELKKRGIKTETPLMPAPWAPVYEAFKEKFETLEVNENTVLVGHSCGCAFLVRWLADSKRQVGKLILVAPWKFPTRGGSVVEEFYNFQIDETIKSRVGQIILFTSDNEREEGKKSLKVYHDALGGKVVDIRSRGHYTFKDMGTEEFPELLQEILEN